jgi:hypothetical protein
MLLANNVKQLKRKSVILSSCPQINISDICQIIIVVTDWRRDEEETQWRNTGEWGKENMACDLYSERM